MLLFAISMVVQAENTGILGKWVTKEGKSHVEISRCDEGLCGKVVWLRDPVYPADDKQGMAGKKKVDRENPDPELRSTPILGLNVLKGFGTSNGNVWEDGTIYDPENGKTYKCKMTLTNPRQLEVRGFIGFSWIGRTTTWTR
ncbi:MAG: hypothetical protein AMJ68_01055 [Acidithiobacillales bacterium SG8_45]|nr:MAG: hypothetical protein AMJ68_01055 [Acidithiobacillales bacterium SG8_45]